VNGKGIEKMRAAGVEVIVGVLEQECEHLNKRFMTFYRRHRPYIVLKWAQTADGFIAPLHQEHGNRMLISGQYTNRLVHQWRSQEASILVGRQTALADNPALTVRLWTGKQPIRLVIDSGLQLPQSLQMFDGSVPTLVFNLLKHIMPGNAETMAGVMYCQLSGDADLLPQILAALYQLRIQSVLVEGGRRTLQAFADAGLWDEARIITNTAMYAGSGIPAPHLKAAEPFHQEQFETDLVTYLKPAIA
jgi:diaminohydroxyphosphoribosylaminopyrimidine deaminase/5-amino-6-(5-phosphoribosylamino)uracil reductase